VLNKVQPGIIEAMQAEAARPAHGIRVVVMQDESTGPIGPASRTTPHKAIASVAAVALARALDPTVATDGTVFVLRTPTPAPPVVGGARAASSFSVRVRPGLATKLTPLKGMRWNALDIHRRQGAHPVHPNPDRPMHWFSNLLLWAASISLASNALAAAPLQVQVRAVGGVPATRREALKNRLRARAAELDRGWYAAFIEDSPTATSLDAPIRATLPAERSAG
jgi:hypothetical protein